MSSIVETASHKSFGGFQKFFSHESDVLGCEMKFSVYFPPHVSNKKFPVLFYFAGLTCTEQNFTTKTGAQKYAAEEGIILVATDTSPRGIGIEGEDDSYDFGTGAGFYVDATEPKWKKNYLMYSYVTVELPSLIFASFPSADKDRQSIMGHSMGGHGALICALRNPGRYRSASAFAPICSPSQCDWGKKAFSGYLGNDKDSWKKYDATELISNNSSAPFPLLIDQGLADNFLSQGQLLPDHLLNAAASANFPLTYRTHEGYDHGYFFIASFVDDHIRFHSKYLK